MLTGFALAIRLKASTKCDAVSAVFNQNPSLQHRAKVGSSNGNGSK